MNTNTQKLLAAAALYGVWLCLVIFNKAPMDSFISWIQAGLISLGVVHVVTMSNTSKPDVDKEETKVI